MMRERLQATARRLTFLLAILLLGISQAPAQQRQQGEPGKFDFYVLSLSWSPSYCDSTQERAPDRRPDQQCASARPYAFVVHGLWPQYEHGFPAWCQVPAPRIPRSLVDSMLDLMPSPRLVFHEWDRHGTCSGLSPQGYFDALRKARSEVKIPAAYSDLDKPMLVSPAEVTESFLQANPKLAREDIAVACDKKRLTEVRICLSKEFGFRACPEVVNKACRLDKVLMPAVRGKKEANGE